MAEQLFKRYTGSKTLHQLRHYRLTHPGEAKVSGPGSWPSAGTSGWPPCSGTLRNADAQGQISTVVDRLPAEGLFDVFREQANHQGDGWNH
jgi:hypothetical protein